MPGFNKFDKILYINLSHRNDRKERILSELEKCRVSNKKIHRIEAHYIPLNGHKGCCISHIKALKYAIDNNFENVLILEDDVVFEHSFSTICQYVDNFLNHIKDWDVFFLSTRVLSKQKIEFSDIFQVTCAQTAHAYAVNKHYFKQLYECYESSLKKMEEDCFFYQSNSYCLDQEWKQLQKKDKWYIGANPIARQGRSVSDIVFKVTDKPF